MPSVDPEIWAAADPVARFTLALDARDARLVAGLFREDGVLSSPDGARHVGHEAILEHYSRAVERVGATRHFLTNGVRLAPAAGIERSHWYALIVIEDPRGSDRHNLLTGFYEFSVSVESGEIAELVLSVERSWRLSP